MRVDIMGEESSYFRQGDQKRPLCKDAICLRPKRREGTEHPDIREREWERP